ncbi:MAG: HepT-like ribonuclease domain-containing protein [Puniceicoccales bacterium]
MPRSVESVAFDILEAISDVEVFCDGKHLEDFLSDRLLQSGVERKLEVIGEALNRLKAIDGNAFGRITDGPRIIGMRNVIAHGYDVIDLPII